MTASAYCHNGIVRTLLEFGADVGTQSIVRNQNDDDDDDVMSIKIVLTIMISMMMMIVVISDEY
jgi:hypothetical protein